MDPGLAADITRWTIYLSLACFVGQFVASRFRPRTVEQAARLFVQARRLHYVSRWLWTIACLALLAHVTCAFAFYHQWSHAAAYRHTAEQTAAMTGMNWGGGLYFNYA